MPIFVHLTPAKNLKTIMGNGIKLERKRGVRPRGVFAMPVTRNFYISHQWLRELKRRGQRAFVGVYFWVPDDAPVSVGHYNSQHQLMGAAQAAALIARASNQEG